MSLSKIMRVMEFVHDHPEQHKEHDLLKRFTHKEYDAFSRFCFGGPIPFAESHPHGIRLTSYGVREYHQLMMLVQQQKFNRRMLIATGILALAAIYPVVLDLAALWVS